MKKRCRYLLIIGFWAYAILSIGQVEDYEYRAPILQAKTGWNSVVLPYELFSKSNENLSDIRIYRHDPGSDKFIEQPYVIEVQETKSEKIEVDFKIINTTTSRGVFYYTLELSNQEAVDAIHLNFENDNYDWNVHLEGSMDQNSWVTITHNYRIVALKNEYSDFKYSDLKIPESKFNFYKVSFSSAKKPILKSATLSKEIKSKSSYTDYPILSTSREEQENKKASIIELDLGKKLPVSHIKMDCTTQGDYYRPVKIEGIKDSFETDKGWKYRYVTLYQGTLTSIHENEFSFRKVMFQKFRITIKNFDNQPLLFEGFSTKGPNHRIISRMDDTENLWLCFGNKEANFPLYDISYFKDKIPNDLNEASLGEVSQYTKNKKETSPLFKNKWWLWGIIIVMIFLLGTFSLKMLKDENKATKSQNE